MAGVSLPCLALVPASATALDAGFKSKGYRTVMASGRYDRLLQFLRAGVTDGGLARRKAAFAPFGDPVPARMKPGVGSERFANEQNAATAPAVFWFLWCPELADLSAGDRLSDGGREFDIKSVRWDGRSTSEVEVAAVRVGRA